MFIIPFLAALVMGAYTTGGLLKAGKVARWGVAIKLMTSSDFRGREGFLTIRTTVDMSNMNDLTGQFVLMLSTYFPELGAFSMKNGKPVTWSLTENGELVTLKTLLDPLWEISKSSKSDAEMVQRITTGKLLPPLLDFLGQIPEGRLC